MKRHVVRATFVLLMSAPALAVVALWVRSYIVADLLCVSWAPNDARASRRSELCIRSTAGQLAFEREWVNKSEEDVGVWSHAGRPEGDIEVDWERHDKVGTDRYEAETPVGRMLGFGSWTSDSNYGHGEVHSSRVAWMPHAVVASVLAGAALMPLLFIARLWRRADRRAAGLCTACGYDLRDSPDRCPECGRARVGCAASGWA
jgi:hypothetical protein